MDNKSDKIDLIQAVKKAGVIGAGGAGFPTHIKLNTKADCFIVNAAECEPLIETDKYISRTFPDKIINAAKAVSKNLNAKRTVIALKHIYTSEIKALKKAVENSGENIEIFELPAFYPAGDEQMLVHLICGKTVPERGIPLDVGAVVDNVGTMLNIYDALEGKPVTDKYLSVVGEVKEPVMLHVPIGTPILECINKAEPVISDYAVILGGPMMGKVYKDDDEIRKLSVTKTLGNIIVLPKNHYLIRRAFLPLSRIRIQAKSACVQCRTCTGLCPRYLIGHKMQPHLIMRNLFREQFISDDEEYKKTFGMAVNCSECGLCEMFSCPMGLSPRKINHYLKGKLKERGIKVDKNMSPSPREETLYKRVPTYRLAARLDIMKYYDIHSKKFFELEPQMVVIPFNQHIGKPAVPIKSANDFVKKGEIIASAAQGALSANVHSSIDGIIVKINNNGAVIQRKREER